MTYYSRLTESDVARALAARDCPRIADGEGLNLQVRNGFGWWTWRYRDRFQGGKAVEIYLGSLSAVDLANAGDPGRVPSPANESRLPAHAARWPPPRASGRSKPVQTIRHEMKIERDEDGWINIKRIGGVKFVPVTALELQGNEDAEELADYGFIKFSGLDGEAMGRAFGGLYASIADWIGDVLTEQIPYDLTEKEDRRQRGAFLYALIRWELLPDLQVALQRIGHPWAYTVPPRGPIKSPIRRGYGAVGPCSRNTRLST